MVDCAAVNVVLFETEDDELVGISVLVGFAVVVFEGAVTGAEDSKGEREPVKNVLVLVEVAGAEGELAPTPRTVSPKASGHEEYPNIEESEEAVVGLKLNKKKYGEEEEEEDEEYDRLLIVDRRLLIILTFVAV